MVGLDFPFIDISLTIPIKLQIPERLKCGHCVDIVNIFDCLPLSLNPHRHIEYPPVSK